MFTNLNEFDVKLELYCEGELVDSVVYPMPSVESGKIGTMDLPLDFDFGDGEVSLVVNVITREANAYSEAGHVVAYEQFILKRADFALPEVKGESGYAATDVEIVVSFGGCRAIIDKETGKIISIGKQGKEKLKEPFELSFYRATIDNDRLPQVDIPIA